MLPRMIVAASISGLILTGGAFAQTAEPADTDQELRSLESLKKDLIDSTSGFYLSPVFSFGYVAGDADIEEAGISIEDEFDGWILRFGGAAGYQTEFLRSEIELTAGRAEAELDILNENADINYGKLSALSFFDVPYDLSMLVGEGLPETIPYVGFGVGGLYYELDGADADLTFVAEVLAGIGVRLSPRWFLDGGYRWTYVPVLEDEVSESEVSFNSIEAKFRYRF
ncbi:MAG: hypothetical protein AAGA21_22955 [Pseudomonadota bacterium]